MEPISKIEFSREELLGYLDEVQRLTQVNHLVVMGSMAALAVHDAFELPLPLRRTSDIDITTRFTQSPIYDVVGVPALSAINENFGRGSDFSDIHGFYIEGVTSALVADGPRGWESRLCKVALPSGSTILALDLHDLAALKLAACRYGSDELKDVPWLVESICCGLIQQDLLAQRIRTVPQVLIKTQVDMILRKLLALSEALQLRDCALSDLLKNSVEDWTANQVRKNQP